MIAKQPLDPDKALSRLAGLCARSEQCEYDLRQKLLRWNVSRPRHDEIISWLIDHKFLDDARFANAYCRDKFRFNHWGKIKIRIMLKSKRISDDVIEQAIHSIDSEEYARQLDALVKAQARQFNLADYNDKNKLMRRLAARGFSLSEISAALNRYSQRNS